MTVTRAGHGDRFPVTAAGRDVAGVLILAGTGLIGVLTATVANYSVEKNADEGIADTSERLDRMESMPATLVEGVQEADSPVN